MNKVTTNVASAAMSSATPTRATRPVSTSTGAPRSLEMVWREGWGTSSLAAPKAVESWLPELIGKA